MLPHAPDEHNPSGAPCPHVPAPQPRCPFCGCPWPPLDLARSGLIDYVVLAKDVLNDLQAALEAEGQP